MGMGLLGDHADETEVTFHAWTEQDTGYVARMVFEGVPPALPPLGMLYLFDHNMLKASGIPEPHPDAMASSVTDPPDGPNNSDVRESVSYAPIIVTDPRIKLAPISPLHGEELLNQATTTADTIEPADDLIDQENASSTVESRAGVGQHDVASYPPVVERRDGLTPEWTLYVLPVDGYSIEFPAEWEVSALADDGGSLLIGTDPAGHDRWEIRRFAGTHTIFNLLQDRVDALESEVKGGAGRIDVSVDTSSHVPEARLRYETVDGNIAGRKARGAQRDRTERTCLLPPDDSASSQRN